MSSAVQRLSSRSFEKVWGSPLTEPWYSNPEHRKIGEIWFSASDAVPLLVKLLFTSEKLSVQVHPDDEYAGRHEQSRGKTEMWHVLRAEPDAKVAVGLRERITADRLREASLSGEIVDLLNWIPARQGDTFFIPARTIHAIGAGLAICEIQQISDVTYRLYDYGRRRELHLDKAMEVSYLEPREDVLDDCPYFRMERLDVNGSVTRPARSASTVYIPIFGEGTIAGQRFQAGEAWEVGAAGGGIQIESTSASFLITSKP